MPHSGETARDLILVGLILDGFGELVLLALGFSSWWFGLIFLGFAFIGFVWIFLVYLYAYESVRDGDYEGARRPTLIFGILSLLTLAIVPGILFLIAYAKLGNAIREEPGLAASWDRPPIPSVGTPFLSPSAPGVPRYCTYCGRPGPAGATFCTSCGVWLD